MALTNAIRAADGVIFITPEYNFTIPGALKNAVDWVSRTNDQPFKDKPVAIQSATGGPLGGARMQYHMRQAMTFLNALAAIMHHVARFCTSVERARAGDPTGWIGVRPLAVQRVWG